jgi:hypothetical protein
MDGGLQSRPFSLVAGSRLQALRTRIVAVLDAWCADWGMAAGGMTVRCHRAWEHPALARRNWQAGVSVGVPGAGGGWQVIEPGFVAQVQMQILPPERAETVPSTSMAGAAAQKAVQALTTRMSALAQGGAGTHIGAHIGAHIGTQTSAAACFAYASGALVVEFNLGASSMIWLFDAAAVTQLAPVMAITAAASASSALTLPPLVPRRQAIANLPVRLVVEAGRAEVNVGNFLTLLAGDVVRLNRSIDAPLQVLAEGGGIVFDGYLGKVDKVMAVETVRHT